MIKKSKIFMFAFMVISVLGLTLFSTGSTYAACPNGIVSYWKLDETAGPTYSDFIGDNNGTGNADPAPDANGRVNGAQQFDGADSGSGIDVPASRSFNWHGDENFSIEYWIKIDAAPVTNNDVALGRFEAGGVFWFTGIEGDTGFAIVTLQDTDAVSETLKGTTNLADSAWHHIVVVRDNSSDTNFLYVDGVEEDKSAAPVDYTGGFLSNSAKLNIGWLDFTGIGEFRFLGSIDEVAIYDRALDPVADILAHYNAGPGVDYCAGSAAPPPVSAAPFPDDTISLWKLDETAGPDYVDSFNGNDGTGNADPAPDANGRVNGAQQFDGADGGSGIDVPASRSYDWLGNENFSIEYWIKIDAAPVTDNDVALGRFEAGGVFWFTGIEGDTGFAIVTLQDTDAVSETLKGTTNLADSAWHHIVVVRDNSSDTNFLYVDGVEEDKSAAPVDYTGGFLSNSAKLNIGWLDFTGIGEFRFLGSIDEVALYDRALTPDEIEDHFEAGEAGRGIDRLGGVPEIIGSWGSGIWYWDTTTSLFTNMTELTGAIDIAAGDFNADGIADVASSWVSGLWYQDGSTLDWTFIDSVPPSNVTAGDVTGDGRDEIIVARDSGIYYWDATTSQFTEMTTLTGAFDIAAGDFNADGIADVASSWVSGLWYQDGSTLDWTFIDSVPPSDVTAGDVTGDGRDEIIVARDNGIYYWDATTSQFTEMTTLTGAFDIAAGDFNADGIADVASSWVSGLWYQDGSTLDWTFIFNLPPTRVTAGDVTGQ